MDTLLFCPIIILGIHDLFLLRNHSRPLTLGMILNRVHTSAGSLCRETRFPESANNTVSSTVRRRFHKIYVNT